jgi:hypothetical protein
MSRIALAVMEERKYRVARISGRVQVLYYSAYQTQYSLDHFKVELVGFE